MNLNASDQEKFMGRQSAAVEKQRMTAIVDLLKTNPQANKKAIDVALKIKRLGGPTSLEKIAKAKKQLQAETWKDGKNVGMQKLREAHIQTHGIKEARSALELLIEQFVIELKKNEIVEFKYEYNGGKTKASYKQAVITEKSLEL